MRSVSGNRCDRCPETGGPHYTITVVAHQTGSGTRGGGKDRRKQSRYVVGRVCGKCLRRCVIRVKGRKLSLPLSLGLETTGKAA